MSLQTALSGLLGAQTALDTVSNDLANASTTAFKSQSALFQNVYAYGESNTPGIGVSTESINSNYSQGDVVSTGNPLNAAIQGNGFFVIQQNGQQEYTRDGSFNVNSAGQLVNGSGAAVLGYAQNANGTTGDTLGPISVNTGSMPAQPSSKIGLSVNLDSTDKQIPSSTSFDPDTASSYNSSTPVTVYDSLGNSNNVQLYFQQTTPANGAASSWIVYAQTPAQAAAEATAVANGTSNPASGNYTQLTTLNFNSSGALTTSPSTATLSVPGVDGAATTSVALDFGGTAVSAQGFSVSGNTNNGYAAGTYSGSSINDSGQLVASYSNGQTITAGTLGIANFTNQEGLTPLSGNLFAQTENSGNAVVNTPGVGQAGTVDPGSLEQSNVSTSALLVSLIQYQQAYQANTSVIQTEQQDSTRLTQI
jgi:flagellar hook protein FlgE